jgi:hypothetical protein
MPKNTSEIKTVHLPVADFDRDFLFACRFGYYCLHRSIVDDAHYDRLENEYKAQHGRASLPVGSDKKEDYTEAQRALAIYFIASGRSSAPTPLSKGPKFF